MKAIILAAGEGKRLRPFTEFVPKRLVEYQKKPILDYQLEVFRQCGIDQIILIKGYRAEAVKRPGTLEVINPRYDQTNMVATLFCARAAFTDDLIISYGDIIYEKSILEKLIQSRDPFAVVVSMNWRELWEKRMADPLTDAETMKLDKNGFILELGKKPSSYADIQGQYMGLFKIKKALLPQVMSFYDSLDKNADYDGKNFENMFMTTFIQRIIDSGIKVRAVEVTGQWLEIDSPEDLKVSCQFS